jgi:hypothetical protein
LLDSYAVLPRFKVVIVSGIFFCDVPIIPSVV